VSTCASAPTGEPPRRQARGASTEKGELQEDGEARTTALHAVYGWWIELQWKRWKSLCHFDRLPNYRDDTILSWLTAKVLLGLLLERIGSVGLNTSTNPLARQPWKMTTIVWPLIMAALLPLRLAHAADRLPAIADHLDNLDGEAELAARQVSVFRRHYPASSAQLRP
jgi:hypothetical protein